MADLAKEIIKEFAMEIAELNRDKKGLQDMYSDLYSRHQDSLAKNNEQGKHLMAVLEENSKLRKELEQYKDCNQEFFKKEIADRDNIIGMERAEMQKMKEKINKLEDENLKLTGEYKALEAEFQKMKVQTHSATETPAEEPTDSILGKEETVDTDHRCKDYHHAASTGTEQIHCCQKDCKFDKDDYACGDFDRK